MRQTPPLLLTLLPAKIPHRLVSFLLPSPALRETIRRDLSNVRRHDSPLSVFAAATNMASPTRAAEACQRRLVQPHGVRDSLRFAALIALIAEREALAEEAFLTATIGDDDVMLPAHNALALPLPQNYYFVFDGNKLPTPRASPYFIAIHGADGLDALETELHGRFLALRATTRHLHELVAV